MKETYYHYETYANAQLIEAIKEYDSYLQNREGVDVTEIYEKLYEAMKTEERIKHNIEVNNKLNIK
jgi:hypothetical protein